MDIYVGIHIYIHTHGVLTNMGKREHPAAVRAWTFVSLNSRLEIGKEKREVRMLNLDH